MYAADKLSQVPLALFVAFVPRIYSGMMGPGKKYFDPQNPRKFVEKLEKAEALDKKVSSNLASPPKEGSSVSHDDPELIKGIHPSSD
jgi:hypothetical protein